MTREQMIEAIRAVPDANFQSEIAHRMGIEDREYEYDELSAILDLEDRIEVAISDKDATKDDRSALRFARQTLIQIGYYRAMSDDEIENTWTSSGRSPWTFKLAGVAYTENEDFPEPQFPGDDDAGSNERPE